MSALAAIINDKGRAAGHSGLGMVMGSKRLKGVVTLATGKIQVTEDGKLRELRKQILNEYYLQKILFMSFFIYTVRRVLLSREYSKEIRLSRTEGMEDELSRLFTYWRG